MKRHIPELLVTVFLIFVFAYFLNFVWESFHAVFLYEEHNISSRTYVLMMNYAAAVDGCLVVVIHGIVSLVWKDPFWLRRMSKGQALTAAIAGIAMAVLIEYANVHVHRIWSYKQLMPTAFGIGLSPLAQLSTTAIVAMWLTKKVLYEKGIFLKK
jgi:hypothetical protein